MGKLLRIGPKEQNPWPHIPSPSPVHVCNLLNGPVFALVLVSLIVDVFVAVVVVDLLVNVLALTDVLVEVVVLCVGGCAYRSQGCVCAGGYVSDCGYVYRSRVVDVVVVILVLMDKVVVALAETCAHRSHGCVGVGGCVCAGDCV